MALPTNTGAFIHNGVNCTPSIVPTAQSIPMSASDSTSVKDKIDSLPQTMGEVFYGYCATQPTARAEYNAWSVTLINGDDFALTAGVTIYIKFEYGEDGTSLLPPVLNVNNLGERPIYYTYANNTGYTPRWLSGQSCILTYDGGRWLLANPQQSAYLTPYHNSTSGLTATNVQGAIDEVNVEKANVSDFQVFSGMTRSTTDITTTNTKVTLQTKTFTVLRNSTIIVNFSAVIKTSRYTSGLNVYLDGTDIGYSCTNLTSYITVNGSCTANIGSGSHTIELKLSGQDSETTATLANYNTYGFNGVIIPR